MPAHRRWFFLCAQSKHSRGKLWVCSGEFLEKNMKTDVQLQQDVIAQLKWDPSITDTQIGVSVANGVVTLNGHVASFAEKWEAEKIVQRVSGVKALAVEIQVDLPSSSKRTDADIARSVENVLEWSSHVFNGHIKVMVENGWVTLTGEVMWEYQRRTAAHLIRYLRGVMGVINQVNVKYQASSNTIKSDIEAAIKRQAKLDEEAIKVDVNGSEVTLSGKVHSYFERNYMANSAWSAPGVQKVVNNLIVSY
jgi:osmotically-inducible protein OsmY